MQSTCVGPAAHDESPPAGASAGIMNLLDRTGFAASLQPTSSFSVPAHAGPVPNLMQTALYLWPYMYNSIYGRFLLLQLGGVGSVLVLNLLMSLFSIVSHLSSRYHSPRLAAQCGTMLNRAHVPVQRCQPPVWQEGWYSCSASSATCPAGLMPLFNIVRDLSSRWAPQTAT